MSIKLYNGYAIPKMSLDELNEFTKRVQLVLNPIANDLYQIGYSKELIYKIDDIAVKANGHDVYFQENHKGKNLALALWLNYQQRLSDIKTKNQRDPEIDFDTYAIYLPIKDKILVWFITEHKKIRNAWESVDEVQKYDYYDGEKPENITQENWEQRLKDWTEAFGDNTDFNLNEVGFKTNLITNDNVVVYPKHEAILKYTPSKLVRLWRLAENDYIDRYLLNERTKQNIIDKSLNKDILNFYYEAKKNIKDGLVEDELKELIFKFEKLIEPEFTKDLLFEKLKIN